ncbi:hypothetical protein CYLTODRAFT_492428 [Cylindrobasidium torrendii FP15055 ss-10]|uniref:PalH-domain-containing protein n=1 Tax=Cylindrobasidium torrendii FP15055 ss-10 TaxID=1314674 RepID=A0A0D7B4B4_9AGAR|nr:hypothetical protein CYLTODRAFT_492428 [Cylindrobasidium torrendii FP15055 ss-10]
MLVQALAWLLLTLDAAKGQQETWSHLAYDTDPYLQFRPAFSSSLPLQILIAGVIITLTSVLFIYLLFTAQYHWPLAPLNYVLQMSSVTVLLVSIIATLNVVLSATAKESQQWPFMLSYIAVKVPPLDGYSDAVGWSTVERTTWLLMNATTSGLIQITHIQFLTLLYPSKLESRMIYSMLGPLALLAAIMQLLPIRGSQRLDFVALHIRNVCNGTLSLLFTAAISFWSLVRARQHAWRSSGGVALFGCAALTLALVSTALTFLHIVREADYLWLTGLVWSVVQWQSFLGWWWWVATGSGSGLPRYDDPDYFVRRETRRTLRTRRSGNDITLAEATVEGTATSSGLAGRGLAPGLVNRFYGSLRRGHNRAVGEQALERVSRIRARSRREAAPGTGWGFGSYAFRLRPEEEAQYSDEQSSAQNGLNGEESEQPEIAAPSAVERRAPPKEAQRTTIHPRSSVLWWGPLARWRLQDSTAY